MRTTSERFVDTWVATVISTKAEGRAEKSGGEWALRQIRGQMSRLRFAPLDMTNADVVPPYEPGTGYAEFWCSRDEP